MAVLVPVLIGLSIFGGFGWRPGLVLAPILAVPVLAVWSRGLEIPEPRRVATSVRGSLTPAYWAYWATLVLVVSVEFCMIYWTTAFFRTVFGLDPALAAGALTLFLLGMLVGSAAGGRIALRWPPTSIEPAALLLAGLGFAVFWLSPVAAVSLVAVSFTGLGVASLYPMSSGWRWVRPSRRPTSRRRARLSRPDRRSSRGRCCSPPSPTRLESALPSRSSPSCSRSPGRRYPSPAG